MHAGERVRPWKAPARQIPRRGECWSDRVAVGWSTLLTRGRRSWWRPSIWCRSRTQLIDRVWAAVASRRLSTAPSAGLMKAAAVCCPFFGLVDRPWSHGFGCGSGRVDMADEQGLRRELPGVLVALRVVAATSLAAAPNAFGVVHAAGRRRREVRVPRRSQRTGWRGSGAALVSHRELPESGDGVTPESVEARRLETLHADAVQV